MSYEESKTEQFHASNGRLDVRTDKRDQLLRAADVAQILGVSNKRVYELGIPEVRLSPRTVRWRYGTVIEWIERHAREAA